MKKVNGGYRRPRRRKPKLNQSLLRLERKVDTLLEAFLELAAMSRDIEPEVVEWKPSCRRR